MGAEHQVYLDSNVFLFAFSGDARAISWLQRVADGSLSAVTSCLTWDEFVWNLRKKGKASPVEITFQSQQFLSFPHLGFVEIDEEMLASAHRIIREYDLKPRDAIHAASAMSRGITNMISEDPDFDKVRGLKRVPLSETR